MIQQFNGMPADDLGPVDWRKSGRSNPTGNCLQLARRDGGKVAMRDSKNPESPALICDGREIGYFVDGLRAGRYDDFMND
jgi:hypothetical protein